MDLSIREGFPLDRPRLPRCFVANPRAGDRCHDAASAATGVPARGSWLFATLAIWSALLRLPLYGACTLLLAAGLGRPISAAVASSRLVPADGAIHLRGAARRCWVCWRLSRRVAWQYRNASQWPDCRNHHRVLATSC